MSSAVDALNSVLNEEFAAAEIANADSGTITEAATRLTDAATDAGTYGRAVADGVSQLDTAWEGTSADAFVAYMGRFAAAGTGLCAEVAGDIDTHLAGTEQTLAAALGTIDAAKSPATRFSTLGEPNTQPFTPRPGQRVDWVPTPPAETTPAGTDQPPASPPPSARPPAARRPGTCRSGSARPSRSCGRTASTSPRPTPSGSGRSIQHESGGDPHAINDWDSNAAKSPPSKGLMQTIDPTFDSYQLPGHGDIWNPVDNICAGVNYAMSHYGSLAEVPWHQGDRGRRELCRVPSSPRHGLSVARPSRRTLGA